MNGIQILDTDSNLFEQLNVVFYAAAVRFARFSIMWDRWVSTLCRLLLNCWELPTDVIFLTHLDFVGVFAMTIKIVNLC